MTKCSFLYEEPNMAQKCDHTVTLTGKAVLPSSLEHEKAE
jgi:hypothetical protein